LEVESLAKANIPDLIKSSNDDVVTRVLEIRQELAKTSVKKYQAMERSCAQDGRIRGLLQF
jgi:DNA polymerase